MTDKEIIDVNKCKYRDMNSNFCLAEKDNIGECYTICTGNDCYYKQLRRKEQECDRYKQALEKIEERISYINTFLIMINNAMIPSYVKTSSYNAQENINKILDIINEVK